MSERKESTGDGLQKEDADLWRQMTDDVERLPGKDYAPPADKDKTETESARPKETPVIKKQATQTRVPRGFGLDKRTDERLRRGQMKIEARLDLHGMTQDEAREALQEFILHACDQGRRCVLVITGKGRNAPGVLRENVPRWLGEVSLRDLVLKTYPAQPKDGGDGALYVLLRRRRSS